MAEAVARGGDFAARSEPVAGARTTPAYQAYWILYLGFVAAPIIAGADKFLHLLVNWDVYLAPQIARMLPFSAHTFMLIVGAIEVVAGVIVLLAPRIGGMIVGLWLVGIIGNLLIGGMYFDIALRDLGLCLGAFALSRLATHFEEHGTTVART
jgi:hypothetical protein